MATRQNINIALNLIGTGSPDTLQTMLLAGKPNQEIANAMGCDVKALVWALAQPAPFPLKPLHWTASPAAGAVAPYIGVTPIAYAGPSTPGYTYGAPLAAREDFS